MQIFTPDCTAQVSWFDGTWSLFRKETWQGVRSAFLSTDGSEVLIWRELCYQGAGDVTHRQDSTVPTAAACPRRLRSMATSSGRNPSDIFHAVGVRRIDGFGLPPGNIGPTWVKSVFPVVSNESRF